MTTRARSDHKVRLTVDDRIYEPVHLLGTITAIAIEENDDLTFRRERAQSGAKRTYVSRRRLRHYASTSRACDFGSAIFAAVVHDDDFVRKTSRNGMDHVRARFLFVPRRDQ